MTVIEYFISGILCIFQNQMECHFFFSREMGVVSVLVSHSNHILDGKQDEWAWEFPGEKRRDRKGERRSFFILSSSSQHGFTWLPPSSPDTEPTVPWTTSAADWGYVSFPDPCVISMPHRDEVTSHTIHSCVPEKHRASDMESLLPGLPSCPWSKVLFSLELPSLPTSLKSISLQMKVMSSKCQLGWRMNYAWPPSVGQKFCLFLKVSGIEVLQKPQI